MEHNRKKNDLNVHSKFDNRWLSLRCSSVNNIAVCCFTEIPQFCVYCICVFLYAYHSTHTRTLTNSDVNLKSLLDISVAWHSLNWGHIYVCMHKHIKQISFLHFYRAYKISRIDFISCMTWQNAFKWHSRICVVHTDTVLKSIFI